jgi:mannosyltransferase OCH1-like enzyme
MQSQLTWKTYHPDYEYMFWSDEDMSKFVQIHYSWFYPTWVAFDLHIKRVDTARYCWLHYFGGMYCDLDMVCKKNVEPLLEGFDVVTYKTLLSEKQDFPFAGNAWMASVKEHPIWIEMLNYTKDHAQQKTGVPADVLSHTGPRALGQVFVTHIANNPDANINIVCPEHIGNEDEPPYEYAYHGRTHTW